MSITSTGTSFPLASLYVGDLHPEVTEAMLFEKFSSAGAVLSIRVCRDMITRRSLGYAYVNFQDPSVAERAIETMNYDSIKGRPIRIMWSQRDPSLRRSGQGNIFIKNLDKSIDNKSMYDTFSGFGPILSCKVAQDENGNSKGYAFVHFESDQAATAAIEKINGMMLNGKKVFVGRFIPRSERDQNREGQPRKFTNVFVKNFEEELDDDKLHELFKEFGNITSHRVMTDPQTGKSRGFGFVSFDNPESAEKAVEKMNGHQLGNGKTLYVGRAQKRAERQQELRRMFEAKRQERQSRFVGANLYVKNLDESVDDEQLKAAFVQFGNINSAKIMREGGRSKGFGFVCFSSPEEATKAVSAMNGHVLAGKPLYVAMAQRKEDRRVQMAASMMRRFQPTPQQQFGGPNAAAAAAQFQQQLYQQLPPGMQYMFPAGAMPQRGFFPAAQMGGGQFGGMMARQPRPYAAMGGPRTQYGMNSTGYARMPRAPRMNNMGPRGVPQQAGGAMGLPTQQQQQPQPGGPVNVPGGVPPQSRLAGPSVMGGVRQQQQNGMMPPNQQGGPIGAPGQPGLRTGAQSFVRPAPTAAQMTARPAATTTSASGIDPSVLAQAAPADQKQMLGEKLFPIIQKSYPELAGKVTGMLLEIDNAELLLLLDSPDQLKNKVEEAVSVLKKHIGKAPVTAPGGGAPEGGDGHKVEPAK